jgi:hypothetical protein
MWILFLDPTTMQSHLTLKEPSTQNGQTVCLMTLNVHIPWALKEVQNLTPDDITSLLCNWNVSFDSPGLENVLGKTSG